MATEKPRVLFLCAHNAARSQVAEALLRHHASDRFEACSAGLDPTGVHPLVHDVLAEANVDTHGLRAKSVREFLGNRGVRYAVVLANEPSDSCPRIYPFATQTFHWPIPDPTAADGAEDQTRERFRAVRDEIDARLRAWLSEREAPAVLAS
jgi:arsenate reductase (thioredoxin)